MSDETNKKTTVKSEIFEWAKVIVTALVLAFIITRFVIPSRVQGESMFPTLVEKDYLVVNRMSYRVGEPKDKDIVVFKSNLLQDDGVNKKDLVKRIIAVGGQHIQIKDSKVYVDGILQNETPYIHENVTEGNIDIVVPKDKVFAMGDNRQRSLDSRAPEVGLVDKSNIIGKVSLRLYPFDKIGTVE
ncbi:MAG: signal peptidase I [Clostridioides sp.]|jgi:signal peptidase I|nr:signal peptidase I [Clostridioides sp.]